MSDMSELSPSIAAKRDRLLDTLRGYESCAVAFSAGVDSTVVAKAAQLALGDRAVAVTGVSASLAEGELESAVELAALIGIRHETLATDELADEQYTRNAADRCYHCKTQLYEQMAPLAERFDARVIVNGANIDDIGDYRPGMIAAGEHRVRSPLIECDINKAEVRQLAAHWELPVADKPATPCLSSRIAYGEEVTPERLRMIDSAEQFLRARGLPEVRVRFHRGEMARIEVPVGALAKLCDPAFRKALVEELKSLGFTYVTLDLEGFRSGSQNEVLAIRSLASRER
ncbi:MAG: ATP-dependent sacrificial sulfur transferase LarE [Planctomycetes bacterium]|nr:ATP-dependent sacrificial sulfur transferase LarE [Planctomycetota bacterium]